MFIRISIRTVYNYKFYNHEEMVFPKLGRSDDLLFTGDVNRGQAALLQQPTLLLVPVRKERNSEAAARHGHILNDNSLCIVRKVWAGGPSLSLSQLNAALAHFCYGS